MNIFHKHLDKCERCRQHIFDLCPEGQRALEAEAAISIEALKSEHGERCQAVQKGCRCTLQEGHGGSHEGEIDRGYFMWQKR